MNAAVSPLDSIRFVLVATTHPGNIGAAARAMKTMGLGDLALVAPEARFPSAEATARAAGADDVLHRARICEGVDDAIADCTWVVGTSARARRLDWGVTEAREAAARMVEEAGRGPVAVLFGQERSGLSNEELDRCHAHLVVPTVPEFASLNLAAAVQLVAYELRLAAIAGGAERLAAEPESDSPPATAAEVEGMHRHLREALLEIGYLDPEMPKLLERRLRRLFNRVQPDRAEVNIVRGILAAAQRRARSEKQD